jgi:hypothetical protein
MVDEENVHSPPPAIGSSTNSAENSKSDSIFLMLAD